MRVPMIVKRAGQAAAAALLLGLGSGPAAATVMPLNLNDFFPVDPADPVTITPDGSSATIGEDPFFSPILLTNDPGAGHPTIIIPAPGRILAFEFDFDEPAGVGNDDEFGAFVLDGSTGSSIDPAFEFFAADTSSGTVEFDLSTLVGELLGMQFQLLAGPGDDPFASLTSTVTISNLRLVDPVAVPAPGSLVLLLGAALLAAGARMRRAHRVT